ncbi:unnamed protein product [Vitrella brassicaformis CCMP3155]|uniref:Hypoxia up-regulated protein 1 n=2 Tax=Vitrella brassicaformis TaxID=1169539 RepID=A0A0G4EEK0_VITBC|nr:unnamed protein product [Vitrella brassicaformis CCMP3155]|eukprot:CEL94101.1 unnamed protein product [Vitrella brassicaformis CCMP3155]
MRIWALPSLLIFLLAASTCVERSKAVVIGLDFGEEFFKVALVKPGKPFEIVLNVHSKRKTPTAVSFHDKTRAFGDDALAHTTKSPHKVFTFTNALLGQNSTEPSVGLPAAFYAYKLEVDAERGSPRVTLDTDRSFYSEEISAALLGYAKKIAETSAEGSVRDCVITVPCTATQRQRQALIDAATIAGFNVLALVHENTAAAVHHALDVNATEAKKTVLFYNMGSKYTEVSLVHYSGAKSEERGKKKDVPHVQVLGCTIDPTIGGHYGDLAIAQKMADTFKEKHKNDLSSQPKVLRKLLRQAVRSKHILSANRKADFYVESLTNDIDFRSALKREEFEKMLEPMFKSIEKPVNEVLQLSSRGNVTYSLKDIDVVELIGGGWRIPRVQEELEKLFKQKGGGDKAIELGQHLNGDEAMAMGAAFMGANYSTSFRVKKVLVTDISPYTYRLDITHLDTASEPYFKSKDLIAAGAKLGGKKNVNLNMTEDLHLKLYEDDNLLASYDLVGVTEAAKGQFKNFTESGGIPRVSINFKVESTGLLSLEKASAIFELPPEEDTEEAADDTAEGEGAEGAAAADANTTEDAATSGNATDKDTEDDKKNATDESAQKKDDAAKRKKEKLLKPKKPRKYTIPLTVTTTLAKPLPMTDPQIRAAKDRLADMDKIDHEAQELAKARNTLEAYIYSSREKLEDSLIQKVSLEDSRTSLSSKLMDYEEWLYEDGFSAERAEFTKRLKELQDEMEPMVERANEHENRPKAVELVAQTLNITRLQVDKIHKDKPWISVNKTNELLNATTDLSSWFADKQDKQKAIPDHEAPAFTYVEVTARVMKILNKLEQIQRIPKPKPKPSPPPPKNDTTANATTAATTNATESTTAAEEGVDEPLIETEPAAAAEEETKGEEAAADENGNGDSGNGNGDGEGKEEAVKDEL